MPIAEDLLAPISGEKPSGDNLRYHPIYDKIKEARRKEDPVAQGDWQRPLKEADYRMVIKLSSDALKRNTKDLQIAAWLTEALAYQEGFSGVTAGLHLLRGLVEHFWDTVYPELEDGDPGLRVSPLLWIGEYREMEIAVRSISLTRGGLSWFKYKESRTVGSEADLGESDSKRQARQQAISEGKMTAEDFDADVAATPLTDFEQLMTEAGDAFEALQSLDELCQDKFGEDSPGFRLLRIAIEDVQHTLRMLAATKPQKQPEPEIEETESTDVAETTEDIVTAEPAEPAEPAPRKQRLLVTRSEPVDRDDAIARIIAAAAYLRREDPVSPVPYLAIRGLRWGELRASGADVNPELLEAPKTEIRQQLKRLMLDGQWSELLELAESTLALPCGRGWLDLQRYAVRACSELGDYYSSVASAIRSELCALLKDFPQLPSMTMLDDTATANAETQAWLADLLPPPVAESEQSSEPEAIFHDAEAAAETPEESPVVDLYRVALEAVRGGETERAMEVLAQQIAQERSGRGRFLRRMQLAQICVLSNRHAIAYPILKDLAQEIESRRLESWEQPEAVAETLALLFQSMQKLRFGEDEKRKIYAQICVLDPLQAARLAD